MSQYCTENIGTTCIWIVMLLTPLWSDTASDNKDISDLRVETPRVLSYSAKKWAHILNTSPDDPFASVMPDVFCKKAERIELPAVCGTYAVGIRVFLVHVLDLEHSDIADTIAIDERGQIWSTRESDGIGKLLNYLPRKCSGKESLLSIVKLDIGLNYAQQNPLRLGIVKCRGEEGGELRSCRQGDVVASTLGLSIRGWACPPGCTEDTPTGWVLWDFNLSSSGHYEAQLVEQPEERIR